MADVRGAIRPDNLSVSKPGAERSARSLIKKGEGIRKVTILAAVAALLVALVAGAAAAKVGERAKTFNFKGTAVCEDGSSISVKVTDGNKRGREAAEAHEEAHPDEPMVFVVVRNTTKFEIDDAPASLSEIVAAGGEVRVQSKAPQGSDSFVAHKVSVETDEDRTALANWRGLLRGRNSDRGPGSRSRAGPTTPDAFAGA